MFQIRNTSFRVILLLVHVSKKGIPVMKKVKCLLLLFFCFILLVEARKKRGIRIKKPKPIRIKPIKIKPIKMPKIHAVHIGKKHHHKKKHDNSNQVMQAIVPLFSPPFNGTDTGQVPADSQVDLIEDWLKRIKIVCDTFLGMVQVHSDIEDQRKIIHNIYPPIRVILEADYAHSVQLENENDPARLAAQSLATQSTTTETSTTTTPPTNYYPGYMTDTF